MKSAGQDAVRPPSRGGVGSDDPGYILAVLLIGIAISAVYMTALLPAWRHQAVREREAELVFRGEQYTRAIALYTKKNPGTLPASVDVLLSQKFLRKKYKDPITGDDFNVIGVAVPGQTQPSATAIAPQAGRGSTASPGGLLAGAPTTPGVSGVRSKSTDTSIRLYTSQQQYSLWQFDYQLMCPRIGGCGQAPGAQGGPARGAGPGRGGTDAPGRGGVGGVGGVGGRGGRGGDAGRGAGRGGDAGRGGGDVGGARQGAGGGARGGGS